MGSKCNGCKKDEGVIMYKMTCNHHNCTSCIDKQIDMTLPIKLYQCSCGAKTLLD